MKSISMYEFTLSCLGVTDVLFVSKYQELLRIISRIAILSILPLDILIRANTLYYGQSDSVLPSLARARCPRMLFPLCQCWRVPATHKFLAAFLSPPDFCLCYRLLFDTCQVSFGLKQDSYGLMHVI